MFYATNRWLMFLSTVYKVVHIKSFNALFYFSAEYFTYTLTGSDLVGYRSNKLCGDKSFFTWIYM